MERNTASPAALRRLMQQQLMTGKSLIALAQHAERAIIAGDIKKLQDLEPQQRMLLDQQIRQESARQKMTSEIAAQLKIDRMPTLLELLPRIPREDAVALASLRSEILKTQRRMDRINRSNAMLLENAMEFVRFSLNAITSAALKPARYGVNMARLSAPAFYIDSKA
jgi:flagellar biosynthesis/type III secretory pathway chaperone